MADTNGSFTSRQVDLALSDRHVLIKWHEEGEPCDIVPVQKVVEPTEATIIAGMECKALFKRKPYPATILFVGTKASCEVKEDEYYSPRDTPATVSEDLCIPTPSYANVQGPETPTPSDAETTSPTPSSTGVQGPERAISRAKETKKATAHYGKAAAKNTEANHTRSALVLQAAKEAKKKALAVKRRKGKAKALTVKTTGAGILSKAAENQSQTQIESSAECGPEPPPKRRPIADISFTWSSDDDDAQVESEGRFVIPATKSLSADNDTSCDHTLELLMTKLTGLESMIVKRFNDIDERLMKLEEMQEKKRIKKERHIRQSTPISALVTPSPPVSAQTGTSQIPSFLFPLPAREPQVLLPLQSSSLHNVRVQEGQEQGVWMGTRNTHISEKKKTFIPQTLLEKTVTVTQESVDHVTRDCGTADQLARALMSLLFTRRQMAYGNCTDTCGRWHRLNTDILSAIKLHISSKFSLDEGSWKRLQIGPMNSKCRNIRRDVGLAGKNKDYHVEIYD